MICASYFLIDPDIGNDIVVMSCSVLCNKFEESHVLEWITPQKVVVCCSNYSYNSSSPGVLKTEQSLVFPSLLSATEMVTVTMSMVLITVLLLVNLGSAFITMERQEISEGRQIRVTPHLLVGKPKIQGDKRDWAQ